MILEPVRLQMCKYVTHHCKHMRMHKCIHVQPVVEHIFYTHYFRLTDETLSEPGL